MNEYCFLPTDKFNEETKYIKFYNGNNYEKIIQGNPKDSASYSSYPIPFDAVERHMTMRP